MLSYSGADLEEAAVNDGAHFTRIVGAQVEEGNMILAAPTSPLLHLWFCQNSGGACLYKKPILLGWGDCGDISSFPYSHSLFRLPLITLLR